MNSNGKTAPKPVAVGNGVLVMTSEEFINGFQAGHLTHMNQNRTTVLTDETLTTQILDKLEDVQFTDRYSVGFVVGLIVSLAHKGTHLQEVGPHDA